MTHLEWPKPGDSGRRFAAATAALALGAAGLVAPPPTATPAAAAGCAQSISGTVKNQFGQVPKNSVIDLYAAENVDDRADHYLGNIGSDGRFVVDRLELGGLECLDPHASYVIAIAPKAKDGGAGELAPWYSGVIWKGKLAKGQHLKLTLTAKIGARIKTTTTGGSALRAPAYQIVDAATGKVRASTKAAPGNIGPGAADYVAVAPGTYKVVMKPRAADRIVPIGATTKTVTVKAGQTATASFAMKPGGAISGKVTNPVGLVTSFTDTPWLFEPLSSAPGGLTSDNFSLANLPDRYRVDCDTINKSAGYIVAYRQGKAYSRAACLSASGGFSLKSLPPGSYTVRVIHHSPGLSNGHFVTKNGKKVLFKVAERKTVKAGRITLPAKLAMVKGTITLPKVSGAQCVVGLFNLKGKNATAGSYSKARNVGSKTKISYRVWAKSGKKATYRVRYTCTNDVQYQKAWRIDAISLVSHDRWYSGGAKHFKNAKNVVVSRTKPKTVNVTLRGSKRAQVSAPTIAGTAKVGGTLSVKVPGLAKGAKTYVRWVVNGKVTNAVVWNNSGRYVFKNRRSFTLSAQQKGASVKAQVLVAQNKRWCVVKTTKAVTVR